MCFWQINLGLHCTQLFSAVDIHVAIKKLLISLHSSYLLTSIEHKPPVVTSVLRTAAFSSSIWGFIIMLCLCALFGEGLYQKLGGNSRKPHQLQHDPYPSIFYVFKDSKMLEYFPFANLLLICPIQITGYQASTNIILHHNLCWTA